MILQVEGAQDPAPSVSSSDKSSPKPTGEVPEDCEQWYELFGRPTVQYVFSATWGEREHALKTISRKLQDKGFLEVRARVLPPVDSCFQVQMR